MRLKQVEECFFKRKSVKICIVVTVLFSIILVVLICGKDYEISMGNWKAYEDNYFDVVGFRCIDATEDEIVAEIGEPERIEYNEYNSVKLVTYQYRDYSICFRSTVDGQDLPNSLSIYGSKYRFGSKRIGVGSTRKEIIKAYRGIPALKDSEIGTAYIEEDWYLVTFVYEDDVVVEMQLSEYP